MRNHLLVSLLFTSHLTLGQTSPKLEIELQIMSHSVIYEGETLPAIVGIRNVGKQPVRLQDGVAALSGEFEMRMGTGAWQRCHTMLSVRPVTSWLSRGPKPFQPPPQEPGPVVELQPGQQWRSDSLPSYMVSAKACLKYYHAEGAQQWPLGPGTYQFRFAWTPNEESMPGQLAAGVQPVTYSNVVTLTKKPSRGVDLELEEAEAPKRKRGGGFDEKEILTRFPTSLRAGYILLQEAQGTSPLQVMNDSLGKNMRAVFENPRNSELHEAGMRRIAEEHVTRLETFVNARPEFYFIATMRLDLAARYFALGRLEDAKRMGELAIASPKSAALKDETVKAFMAKLQATMAQAGQKTEAMPTP
jgi:hypothetical protein